MKVLFSIEKYLDAAHPEFGLSCHDYGVVGSLASSNMGIVSCFYYDQIIYNENPEQSVDDEFVERCRMDKPDLVFATCLIQNGDRNIKPSTYGFIRDELKIPVVMFWCESAPDVVRYADIFAPHITANVFIDTTLEWPKHTKHPEKCFSLYEPRDTRLFYCAEGTPRDIPFSFLGTSWKRMDRALNLGYLHGKGVPMFITLGQIDSKLSPFDYAQLLRRSLVTINFSSAITFQHICGRVAEATLCGAMLLESENEETKKLLSVGDEFVEFREMFHIEHMKMNVQPDTNLFDLVQRYAFKDLEQTARIAAAGRVKAEQRCDGREFWKGVFERAGLI